MDIIYLKEFKKSYQKLPKKLRESVNKVLEIFQADPFHPALRNHALKGELLGVRSISVKHDLRIIYEEKWDHAVVYLLRAGSHAQVYES